MKPTIAEILATTSKSYSEKVAIIDRSSCITYGELDEAVRKTARHLKEQGIKPKDRVLVLIPLSIDMYRVTIALNYIGACAIFVEDWIAFTQIGRCCEASNPNAVITNFKGWLFCYVHKVLRKIPVKIRLGSYLKKEPLEAVSYNIPEEEAIISFTSGTSGTPKMVVRSFQFLTHQFYTLQGIKNSHHQEVELQTMPAFLFINLAMGGTSVIADFNKLKPEKTDIRKIEKQLRVHRVNAICASPAFLYKLCHKSVDPELRAYVKSITTGGAPVFPADAQMLDRSFPNANTIVLYGSSEAEPISVVECSQLASAAQMIQEGLLVGNIHPETQVKIDPVFGNLKINKTTVIGEVLVAGPNVIMGTHSNMQNKTIIDGKKWHRTGDSGYLNQDGLLILTGPVDSIIKHKGQLWPPFIFEGITKNIPGISRASLVKVEQRLIAATVPLTGAERATIKQQLEALPIPIDDVVFIQQFPKDKRHDGKIKYRELQEMIKSIIKTQRR